MQGGRQNMRASGRVVGRAVSALTAVCVGVVFSTGALGASVSATRDLPVTILQGTSSFQATLTVTVPGGAPNGAILGETLPAGWTISGATWQGEAFDPSLLGGVNKWLFDPTGTAIGAGTLTYTVNTGGAGTVGPVTFGGEQQWINGGTEAQATTLGDTALTVVAPTTVTSVVVATGLTVEVTFSAAMDVGAGVLAANNYTVSGTGSHTLKWRYFKDGSVSSGDDQGWVDHVQWLSATQPEPASNSWRDLSYVYDAFGRRIEKK